MKKIVFFILLAVPAAAQKFTEAEISQWKQQAADVTITRDTWGIPHIAGKTDADAVFGLLYAQCEDDFERVERNYITALGRLAEAEGEEFIFNDLRQRLFIDSADAIRIYPDMPDKMKKLCRAFADGINYFLFKHPEVQPKLLKRFQPWMPLLFSEGSIGGDIESISLNDIKAFYGQDAAKVKEAVKGDGLDDAEPGGSNGFAIAPAKSASGNAMLLINPHTSFYFRSEVHVSSQEGLNAYGAVTWGQFFVYQGFNEHCGWMHTTSGADVIDWYIEKVQKKEGKIFYQYSSDLVPVISRVISIDYKSGSKKVRKDFTVYRTHHGPVVALEDGNWVTARIMKEPLKALTQSYERTKAVNFKSFKATMMLRANSSNNTVYADDKGVIAYWHGDFMPKRNTNFDWAYPVDGSDPATEWGKLHSIDEIVHVYNPANGWIQNCNSTPFTVSGIESPGRKNYPVYMAPDQENERGIHAVRILKDQKAISLDGLIALANDPQLPGFEKLVPKLLQAYDSLPTADSTRAKYAAPMEVLRGWDVRYGVNSIPTTLAIFWAQHLRQLVSSRMKVVGQLNVIAFLEDQTSPAEKLKAFAGAIRELQLDFGTWERPWGEINRFQRLTGGITPLFDDNQYSLPVGSTSSFWGSLAAFGSKQYPGTKKMYGYVGNSFVAVVEFGKKVRAKSVVTGGSSSLPGTKHFYDQAMMYAKGEFKDVLFYDEDIRNNTERKYHPGE